VILESGSHEALKGGVHRAMQIGAGLCALYNGAAWLVRREPHLALNTLLYVLLYKVEEAHCEHHRSAADV
jgi:hypothetical protein